MKLGVLDVGSNTVHLLIVEARAGGRPQPESSRKWTLRLMRYLDDEGAISDEGIDAILEAVGGAAHAARKAGVTELLPFATSALRQAPNGEATLALIGKRTGVHLRVLSGEDEARITFLAVRRWFGWSAGRTLLIDIGGGSLELAIGDDEYPETAHSVPLGAGRTTKEFFTTDPPKPKHIRALAEHVQETLKPVVKTLRKNASPDHVVGSSKAIRSLAKLAGSRLDNFGNHPAYRLHRDQLDDWLPRLAQLPAEHRPVLPGITEDRTFQIVAGGIVVAETMRALKVDSLDLSPWALREGILLRYLDHLDGGAIDPVDAISADSPGNH